MHAHLHQRVWLMDICGCIVVDRWLEVTHDDVVRHSVETLTNTSTCHPCDNSWAGRPISRTGNASRTTIKTPVCRHRPDKLQASACQRMCVHNT